MNSDKKKVVALHQRNGSLPPCVLSVLAAVALLTVFALLLFHMPPVYAETTETKPDSAYGLSVSINYTMDHKEGILAGQDNSLRVTFENKGDIALANAEILLTLPEQVEIYSGSATQEAGYFSIGGSKRAEFHLTADKKTKSKSYKVEVQISGTDQSGSTRSVSRTFYLPVVGTDAADDFSMSDLAVTAVSLPSQALSGDSFELSFAVRNNGTKNASDLKVTVEPGDGLLNRTGNVFLEPELLPGASKSYKVTLFSMKEAVEKNYPIKITVETTVPSSSKEGDVDKTPVTQYAGVLLVPSEEKDGVKTPRLMVDSYSYGGSHVQAGDSFPLSLSLRNTSGKNLRNIQITVTAAEGAFVPVGTGNTLYLESLAAKEQTSQSLTLRAKNDAEQKTTSVDVDLTYEDTKGNEFTVKNTISIPVTQNTRLVINDVVAPPEIYAAMQSGVSVDFYNMGKSILHNLRVKVAGNFDEPQSNAYFVGNMDPGKSDSYDFSFLPREAGPMAGTITFTYEDASGKEKYLEKAFQFTVMEAAPWEDPGALEPVDEKTGLPWKKLGIGGGAAFAVILALILRKRRRKKRNDALELED